MGPAPGDGGLRALLDSSPGGNLGALDLTLGFKPPDGIDVSVDADPVSGAGLVQWPTPFRQSASHGNASPGSRLRAGAMSE